MIKHSLCALALLSCSALAPAADLPAYPFIHATGSAFLHTLPDVAEIDFEVASADADPQQAWQIVSQRIDAVRSHVQGLELQNTDVDIQQIARATRRSSQSDPGIALTRCVVHITVRDLSKWEATIQPLLAMQNVESLEVAFSRSDREKIEAELSEEAIAEARHRGELMAKAINRKVAGVEGTTLGYLKNISNAFMSFPSESMRAPTRNKGDKDFSTIALLKLSIAADVLIKLK